MLLPRCVRRSLGKVFTNYEAVLKVLAQGLEEGIAFDPNRADDPENIVQLVERVVRVSVETVEIVAGLPPG